MQKTSQKPSELGRFRAIGGLTGLAVVALCAASGCSSGNAQERRTLDLDDPALAGATLDDERCIWESSPWSGSAWVEYPGRVTLDLEHGWDRCGAPHGPAPADVAVYLSFDSQGQAAALGAGDPVVLVSVGGSRLTLRNNTNQDYFVRIVVR
jgi:hypothetical protein